jgi:hypothetical protein
MKAIKILVISIISSALLMIVLTLLIEYKNIKYASKTYEYGLYEGANETLKYLVEKNYINEDVRKNEMSKIDSILQIRIEK